jgi:IS1 family transposase/transposase-like protein
MIQATWGYLLPRLGVLLVLLWFALFWFRLWRSVSSTTPAPAKPNRPPQSLKPRSPTDCLDCVRASTALNPPAPTPVHPWQECKSPRGRPKRIYTEGYACEYEHCAYRGITDSRIHAVVGYGHHGADHSIQDFFCEACHHKFSARRHTALYRLKTQAARVGEVLAILAEGLAVAAAVRVFGHAEGTITTWLTRAGMHSEQLHAHKLRGLHLGHVQLDELRTTLRNKGQEVWLWLALDARTKLIAAAELGPRTQATSHALIHGLVQILVPGCTPVFTSDGLNLYFYSLTAHFGTWVETLGTKKQEWQVAATLLYGQLIKSYRRRTLVRVERVMRWGTLDALKTKLQEAGWSGVLQTAFVERVNLTVRRGLAMFARRSWSTTQTVAQLKDGFAWWCAYYHFVKPHEALRIKLAIPRERGGKRLPQCYRSRTPAVAAGVTDHCWTVVELLSYPAPA